MQEDGLEFNQVDGALAAGEALIAEAEADSTASAGSSAAGECAAVPPAQRGGNAVVEKYGREYMANLGRKGSQSVIRRYGLRFYSEIAARNKGVKKRRKAAGPAEQG